MTHCASTLKRDGKLIERALALSKLWLHRCVKYHHYSCNQSIPVSDILWPEMPNRVVDVRQFKYGVVKFVKGNDLQSPYCALSYKWGSSAVLTTNESIKRFEEAIPLELLQIEIRDAFFIANSLGIPYVWVDALVRTLRSASAFRCCLLAI